MLGCVPILLLGYVPTRGWTSCYVCSFAEALYISNWGVLRYSRVRVCFRCLFCSLFFFSRLSLYIPHFACFLFLCIFCICIFFVHFWVLSGGWEREPCKLTRTSQSREVTIEVRSRFCTYRVKITITSRISSGGAGAGFVLDIVCTCDEAASSRMCLYPVCRVWIPPRVIHPR